MTLIAFRTRLASEVKGQSSVPARALKSSSVQHMPQRRQPEAQAVVCEPAMRLCVGGSSSGR